MLRVILLIVSGNALASMLLLTRNLIIARLIPVSDFGIASTIAIVMAVLEMMSNIGLQQQIVQAKNGESERFQSALQGFQVFRGLVSGTVLFFTADHLAVFLGVPDAVTAYRILALVPIINGMVHFDIYRLNRSMSFLPLILTTTGSASISLLAVLPLSMLLDNYYIMLCAALIQVLVSTSISHLLASRRYSIVYDRRMISQSLSFGWPLLINSILLFGVFQGDKLIVGRELGMETLAIFAMGFTLTLAPTLVMANSSQKFFLPLLSSLDRSTELGSLKFRSLATATMQIGLMYGVFLVLAILTVGVPIIELTLGPKYSSLTPLLIPLSIMQALRVTRTGSSVVALSCAYTANDMFSNLVRVMSLPIMWYSISYYNSGLYDIILIAIVAEAAGSIVSFLLVGNRIGNLLSPFSLPSITYFFTICFFFSTSFVFEVSSKLTYGVTIAIFGLTGGSLVTIYRQYNSYKISN